jgi:tetratricopeptide (TPR) repeat protein
VTEAVEAAHQALEMARANEGPREVAGAWRSLGQAIGAMSDSQGAPRCFEESLRLFTSSGAYADLGRTLRAWAEYELRSGDAALGRELWQRARTLFSEHGVAHELARTAELPPEVELTP